MKYLPILFALLLTACGGGSGSQTPTQDSTAATMSATPVTLAAANADQYDALGTYFVNGVKYCKTGYTLTNNKCVLTTTQTSTTAGPVGQTASAWSLTFSDEFNTTSLNSTKWTDHLWYSTSDPTINYSVESGSLLEWPAAGFVDRHITTDGKFSQTYGYYEIEAKLPYGKGPWPAFWLYAHPCNTTGTTDKCRPEIDIMEAYPGGGVNSGWSDSSLHPTNYGMTVHEANADYSFHEVPVAIKLSDYGMAGLDLSSAFHKYGVKWEADGITFYFDGKQVGSKWMDTAHYFNQPMYVLLSLQLGSASGSPDSTTPTGKTNAFNVNYVRVWKAV